MSDRKTSIPIVVILFALVFILCIDATGTIVNNYGSNSIWKIINNDTIVQNDTSLNVNIGENASTPFKLSVNGSINAYGSIIQNDPSYYLGSWGDFFAYTYCHFYDTLYLHNKIHIAPWGVGKSLTVDTGMTFSVNSTTTFNNNVTVNNDLIVTGKTTSLNFSGYGIVPIATIEDFFGDAYGLPIPDGWQICDGSFITNVDSMIYGYQTPNLTGYFIKGGLTSNTTGGNNSHTNTIDEMASHTHDVLRKVSGISGSAVYINNVAISCSVTSSIAGYAGGGQSWDNQPSYYTCIKIIRIK